MLYLLEKSITSALDSFLLFCFCENKQSEEQSRKKSLRKHY